MLAFGSVEPQRAIQKGVAMPVGDQTAAARPWRGLPPDLARAADDVIDAMMAAAARQVTATGCDLAVAMESTWARLNRETPEVWALAVLRLRETGNEEMLCWADPDERR